MANKKPRCKYEAYKSWRAMRQRCLDSKAPRFQHYGGRGIKICKRWLEDFYNFLDDMGERPSSQHSIDRIDVNGDYEPGNCRWATRYEQTHNRRKALLIRTTARRDSKSGRVGIVWMKKEKRWRARVSQKTLGFYRDIEDAVQAREDELAKGSISF